MTVSVIDAFLAALAPQVAASVDRADVQSRVLACLMAARQALPDIHLDDTIFVAHLARHCRGPDDLNALAIDDLYLACACAQHDPAALRILHEQRMPDLDRALRRLQLGNDELDDVRLAVMQRLVVDDPPKIASYAGRGSLAQWLAAVAAREAIGHQRTAARRRGLLDAAAEDLAPSDPELGFLKAHYRGKFKEAFADALGGLPPSDRTILRHRFVDELTLDQLAAAVGVHRATAARHLARIRTQLLEATRVGLRERLGVEGAEIDSVVRLIASNFEVSVRRLLR